MNDPSTHFLQNTSGRRLLLLLAVGKYLFKVCNKNTWLKLIEEYSESCQKSKLISSAVHFFAKRSILNVLQGSEYVFGPWDWTWLWTGIYSSKDKATSIFFFLFFLRGRWYILIRYKTNTKLKLSKKMVSKEHKVNLQRSTNFWSYRIRGCLYEVRHLACVRRLIWVRYVLPRVSKRKISHLSEILFIPVILHPTYFHCLVVYNFELLGSIHIAKFYKINCTFSRNNYKNTLSLH